MAARRKALFVVSHCPSPDAAQAGHKTAFRFLSELVETHDTDLMVLVKAADMPSVKAAMPLLRAKAKSVVIIPVSVAERVLGALGGLFLGLAPRFCTRLSFRAMIRLRWLLTRTPAYDLVWAEFSQSFWVVKLLDSTPDVLLSLHDVQTQVVSSKSAVERIIALGFTFQSENALLKRATRIRVQSANDKWLLQTLFRASAEKIELVAPTLSTFLAGVTRSPRVIEPHSLLFWGAMSRPENSEAIIAFIKGDFSRLRQKYPDAKLYIVGSGPPKHLSAMATQAIVVTGFIDNPASYFERAGLGVAPLTSGAGIKVKVLEMLAAAIPVISTPIGVEGIAGDPLLTVAEIDAFGATIDNIWGKS